MDNEFEKRLDFDSDTFANIKQDMNFVLQRLIANMKEKNSNEGSMTLKIDVTLLKEFIPNYDPDIKGETREISKPQFKHKVTSVVKINDEKSGALNSEMELVLDEETGAFVMVPIANTTQRTIFDADFKESYEDVGEDDAIDEQNTIEGADRPLLPGPENEDIETVEGEIVEPGEGLDDITDELIGDGEAEDGGDYPYENPDDEPTE